MKKILLFLCAFMFAINVNAQMKTVSLNEDAFYARSNIKATGTSNLDRPSVRYIMDGYSVPTIGELKKIVKEYWAEHDRNLKPGEKKWGDPCLIGVYKYWRGYHKEQQWYYLSRAVSKKHPGKDIVASYLLIYKKQTDGSWRASDEFISSYLVKQGTANKEIMTK